MPTVLRSNDKLSGKVEATGLAERRRSPRQATVLQVAKISSGHCEELCILRDISPDGLRAEIYCDLQAEDRVRFELRNGERIAGRVVWRDGASIGVAFDRKLPVLDALARPSLDASGRKVRAPRLKSDAEGTLRIDGDCHRMRVLDVSPGGARIVADAMPEPGTACELRLDGDRFRKASVCWSRNGELGMTLLPPMGYTEFANWRRIIAPPDRSATPS